MNTLLEALKRRSLSMAEASKKGIPLSTIVKHCKGKRKLGLMSVLRYEAILGIPRSELRPDLWPSPTEPSHEPD